MQIFATKNLCAINFKYIPLYLWFSITFITESILLMSLDLGSTKIYYITYDMIRVKYEIANFLCHALTIFTSSYTFVQC